MAQIMTAIMVRTPRMIRNKKTSRVYIVKNPEMTNVMPSPRYTASVIIS